MAEDREALLQHYRMMREELLFAIDGLSDALMTEPSLDGWSVKDHLAHLALWDDIRASEVVRISAGNDSAWRMTGEQDAAYGAMGHDLRLNISVEQIRWELATSRQRLLDAISSATPRGLNGSLYGEAGLRSGHERQHAGWIKRWRGENPPRPAEAFYCGVFASQGGEQKKSGCNQRYSGINNRTYETNAFHFVPPCQ
ncbi:MAG: DinB family protein [Chloroflexota bacterium]